MVAGHQRMGPWTNLLDDAPALVSHHHRQGGRPHTADLLGPRSEPHHPLLAPLAVQNLQSLHIQVQVGQVQVHQPRPPHTSV